MTISGLVLAGIAVLLLRLGWGGRRPLAVAGWAAAAVSLLLLALGDGAWGIAMGFTLAIAAALSLVLFAASRSPAGARRAPREAASVGLPFEAGDVGRRLAVFALVGPVSFAAAQWLAFAVQALLHKGAQDADSIALTLFMQPVLWTLLMSWQMVLTGPGKMWAPPALAAVLGTIVWILS